MIKERISELVSNLPSGVQLVAVSKFHPLEAVLEAYGAGQRIFAESRPQELLSKVNALDTNAYPDLQWHFIGHLQTNKLKMVLPYVSLVQSVDSLRLLDAIDRWGRENCRVTDILLECHISSDISKQGFSEDEFPGVVHHCQCLENVRVRGVMGMATLTDNVEIVRNDFRRLVSFGNLLRRLSGWDCPEISMGMSGDFRIAVEEGSTMVRIGSLIFGSRN